MRHDADGCTITIFWSDEDQACIAVAKELEGCSALVNNRADALREAKLALSLWLESAKKHGDPVPDPIRPWHTNSNCRLIGSYQSIYQYPSPFYTS